MEIWGTTRHDHKFLSTYGEIGDAKIVEWFCSYELAYYLVETTYIVLFADRYLLKELVIHVSKMQVSVWVDISIEIIRSDQITI